MDPYSRRSLGDVRWFVIHHTGDGPERPTAKQTATFQTTSATTISPFPAIAYTMYVEADGTLEVCHDLEEEVWSNGVGSPFSDRNQEGVYNDWTISCCFSGQDPTTEQWATMIRAKSNVDAILRRSLVLTGHGLLPNGGTECPGPVARSRLVPPVL